MGGKVGEGMEGERREGEGREGEGGVGCWAHMLAGVRGPVLAKTSGEWICIEQILPNLFGLVVANCCVLACGHSRG